MSKDNKWYYLRTEKERENGGKNVVYIATRDCVLCGKPFQNGNVASSKYCEECKRKVRAEQNRERVKRFRERKKMESVK